MGGVEWGIGRGEEESLKILDYFISLLKGYKILLFFPRALGYKSSAYIITSLPLLLHSLSSQLQLIN
jgi:hypothetical protein